MKKKIQKLLYLNFLIYSIKMKMLNSLQEWSFAWCCSLNPPKADPEMVIGELEEVSEMALGSAL